MKSTRLCAEQLRFPTLNPQKIVADQYQKIIFKRNNYRKIRKSRNVKSLSMNSSDYSIPK